MATGTSFVPLTCRRACGAWHQSSRDCRHTTNGGVAIKDSQVESGSVSVFIGVRGADRRHGATGRTNLSLCRLEGIVDRDVDEHEHAGRFTSDRFLSRTTSRATSSTPGKKPVVVPMLDERRAMPSGRRSRGAVGLAEELHLIEIRGVSGARERRRGRRQDLCRRVEGHRHRMLEMGERGGGVGRRRRLPAPGKRRLGVGRKRRNDPAVLLPPRQDLPGDVGADLGAAADEPGRFIP